MVDMSILHINQICIHHAHSLLCIENKWPNANKNETTIKMEIDGGGDGCSFGRKKTI